MLLHNDDITSDDVRGRVGDAPICEKRVTLLMLIIMKGGSLTIADLTSEIKKYVKCPGMGQRLSVKSTLVPKRDSGGIY